MEQRQLKEYSEQLTQYLQEMHASDKEKQALQALIDQIAGQTADNSVELSADQSLSDQVDSLASMFEAEHPTLTGVLNNLMITLTSMGV